MNLLRRTIGRPARSGLAISKPIMATCIGGGPWRANTPGIKVVALEPALTAKH
jgi:hypothetical protein